VLAGLAAAAGFVVWANQTGLPQSWRAGIEGELAKHGIHATIGSLRLHPIKGIVAKDVTLFSDQARTRDFCRLETLLVNVDRTKIARGDIHITRIELTDADIDLRVTPASGPAETLEIRNLSGSLAMPGGRLIELRNARAQVAGFQVNLGARLLKFRPTAEPPPEEEGDHEGLLLATTQAIRELRNWSFARGSPPTLRCFLEGDLSDWSTLLMRVSFTARGVEKHGHVIDEISADGTVSPNLVSLSPVRASDSHGRFEGSADYDFWGGEGRFDLVSSVNMPLLLSSWLGWPGLDQFEFDGSQEIESEGTFAPREDGPPAVRLTGRARCTRVRIKGVPFDSAEGLFSWRDGQLYLRDLHLLRPDGEARGKVMIDWPFVRQHLRTTLPIPVYKPFFVGQPLGAVLNDFVERPGASVEVSIDGGFDASDPHSWAYTGSARVRNVSYRGVPLHSARCDLALDAAESTYSNGEAEFDYRDYPLRNAYQGPERGTLKVDRIHFDAADMTLAIGGVRGAAWAAPVVRTFNPGLADSLELYRFARPPALTASGIVDLTLRNRTNLTVAFSTPATADYDFLGQNITLHQPSATVVVRGPEVLVRDLRAQVFGGPAKGDISVTPNNRVAFDASWEELSMSEINETYQLGYTAGGQVTGRLEGEMTAGRIETLDGKGLLAIERSVLFSAPALGLLSKVLSKVVGEERAGFERAKSAFATFNIDNGVLRTKDFHTSTTSLVFAGDGSVNLTDGALDFNIRVNARGLLGVVTFPLKPIRGLFQFRGTGTLHDPNWDNAPVTDPLPEQRDRLFGRPSPDPGDDIPKAVPVGDG
jgi:hypothetical protein